MNTLDSMRIDKWLWCARFFKTRSIAAEEIGKGRVMVNGQTAKASREVRPGDTVVLRQGPVQRTVTVPARTDQKCLSLECSMRCRLILGCAGFSCKSKAVVLTAFCSSLDRRARLSVKVSAMRKSIACAFNTDPC